MVFNMHKTVGNMVYPTNYILRFEPDMKTFKTHFTEQIKCFAKKRTRLVKLNSKEISISSAKIVQNGISQNASIRYSKKDEEVHFAFKKQVKGEFTISIDAICENNELMYGFYRSRYTDKKGREQYLLSSQFEPADARAAFVCFDEPEFKATYDVSMLVDKELEAISNSAVKSTSTQGKKKLVTFYTSPKMSSYLLYLGVGKFDRVEGRAGKIKISVLTIPGKKDYAKLPLEYAKKFVAFYQNYFGIDYPLPKLDLLAIPDFAAGAMENWGAITFREARLLVDEKSSIGTKKDVATVIAHELTHQWFGDLVTMKWWDDLWLNESFAEFMSTKAVHSTYPKWDMDLLYYEDTIAGAFNADSLKSTHPINVPINRASEVNSIFDAISYDKGGSVLLMLEDYVGKDSFQKGLHEYLSKNAYGNATKEDLWNAIHNAAQEDGKKVEVPKVMKAWVNKPGYPIVYVKKVRHTYMLNQKRFSLLKDIEGTWPIPMHYKATYSNGGMTVESKQHNIALLDEWIKLNYGQKGLYRVSYEQQLLNKIFEVIENKELGAVDAWGISNDMFAFVRSGRSNLDAYLKFVDKCGNVGYPASASISSGLGWLANMTYGTRAYEKVKTTSMRFHKPILKKLGWKTIEGEKTTDTEMRSHAIAALGILGDDETLAKIKELFSKFTKGNAIDVNIRGAVYGVSAWYGNLNTFNLLVNRYKKEQVQDEKRRLLFAIAGFSDEKLLRKALAFAYSKDVRLQDSIFIPGTVGGNPIGKKFIWAWTTKNWKMLTNKYSEGTHMLNSIVMANSAQCELENARSIKRFFAKKGAMRDDIKRGVAQAMERIEANAKFFDRNCK